MSGQFSYLTHLECGRCAETYDATRLNGTCTSCGAPLLARYDLTAIARDCSPGSFIDRPPTLWRYHELLPASSREAIVTLGEGMTPLLPLPNLGRALGIERLLVKDEGGLPTGSFKARGATTGVTRAKELGVSAFAMPTNGNAGAAWSAYAARAGLQACIVMPEDAPAITRRECSAAGADLYLVDGLISDAGRLVGELVARTGWFEASTLKEPYRLEGKKTMGLEIAEQLGWRVPDVIIYPTGGGVGLIGIDKALRELQELGWISSEKLPRLVAVQAAGCAPIVEAFEAHAADSRPWQDTSTIAFGINVPKALGDFLILQAIYASDGCAIAVSDDAILAESLTLARSEGLVPCPEGAATVAAARALRRSGWIADGDEVVLLNTGAGVIYPETLPVRFEPVARDGRLPIQPGVHEAGM
ncbi:MAG TPA: threonine synthase [Solirubrobacteraceae bacterium]|nr:threonine synthase [Solirubrobacteraceae bacterium]